MKARTTGLPEVDLLIAGEKRGAASGTSERTGLLRGLSRAFCFQITPPEKSTSRNGPASFCTVIPADGLSADTCVVRARILAAQPGTRLLAHMIGRPANSGISPRLVRAALRQTLVGQGVDPSRLHFSEGSAADETTVRERLVQGDIYLDPIATGDARWAVEALA